MGNGGFVKKLAIIIVALMSALCCFIVISALIAEGIDEYNDKKFEEKYNFTYISGSANIDSLNLEGYSKMYNVDVVEYYEENELVDFESTFRNLPIRNTYDPEEEVMTIDIYDIMVDYLEHNDNFYAYFKDMCFVDIDENTKLALNHISCSVDLEQNLVRSYYVKGTLLEK